METIRCPLCNKEIQPEVFSSGVPGGVYQEIRCPKCHSFIKSAWQMVSKKRQFDGFKKIIEEIK